MPVYLVSHECMQKLVKTIVFRFYCPLIFFKNLRPSIQYPFFYTAGVGNTYKCVTDEGTQPEGKVPDIEFSASDRRFKLIICDHF